MATPATSVFTAAHPLLGVVRYSKTSPFVVATVPSDGVHVVDVSSGHLVSSWTIKPSVSFACPAIYAPRAKRFAAVLHKNTLVTWSDKDTHSLDTLPSYSLPHTIRAIYQVPDSPQIIAHSLVKNKLYVVHLGSSGTEEVTKRSVTEITIPEVEGMDWSSLLFAECVTDAEQTAMLFVTRTHALTVSILTDSSSSSSSSTSPAHSILDLRSRRTDDTMLMSVAYARESRVLSLLYKDKLWLVLHLQSLMTLAQPSTLLETPLAGFVGKVSETTYTAFASPYTLAIVNSSAVSLWDVQYGVQHSRIEVTPRLQDARLATVLTTPEGTFVVQASDTLIRRIDGLTVPEKVSLASVIGRAPANIPNDLSKFVKDEETLLSFVKDHIGDVQRMHAVAVKALSLEYWHVLRFLLKQGLLSVRDMPELLTTIVTGQKISFLDAYLKERQDLHESEIVQCVRMLAQAAMHCKEKALPSRLASLDYVLRHNFSVETMAREAASLTADEVRVVLARVVQHVKMHVYGPEDEEAGANAQADAAVQVPLARCLDWALALIDGHMTQIVLNSDMHGFLHLLRQVSRSYVGTCEQLEPLLGVMQHLMERQAVPSQQQGQQQGVAAAKYAIEVMKL